MNYFFPILAALSVVGCSASAQLSSSGKVSRPFVYQYRTTACMGTCPVYELTIYSNGRALYRGQQHVTTRDTFLLHFPPQVLDSLRYYLQESRFTALDSSYDNPALADLPGREHQLIEISRNRSTRVWSRVDPPAGLQRLEDYIQRCHRKYLQE